MNNGTLESAPVASHNRSPRHSAGDEDELTKAKRELLLAEVRLAKARASAAAAEIDTIRDGYLYALRFARFMDLARAYYQFAEQRDERGLDGFLRAAGRESGGCLHKLMNKRTENRYVLPFQMGVPTDV